MVRARVFRQLRILVAVLCLTVCALLIVLWARSFVYCDIFVARWKNTVGLSLQSKRGELSARLPTGGGRWTDSRAWYLNSTSMQRVDEFERQIEDLEGPQLAARWGPRFLIMDHYLVFPHWFLVMSLGVGVAALGIRRPYNFGLRAMFVATAIVAAVLGLAMIATRQEVFW